MQEVIPDDEFDELRSVPNMQIQNAYDQMKDYNSQIYLEMLMSENHHVVNLALHSSIEQNRKFSNKSVMAN